MTFNPVGVRTDILLQNNRVQLRFTFKGQTYLCAFIGVTLLMGTKVLINATGECVTRSDICRLMHACGLTMGIFGGVGIYLGIWGLFVGGREPLYYYTRP